MTHTPVETHRPVQTHSLVETLSATSVPSVPSSYSSSAPPSPECGGTPCFVYGIAGGLGALTLILLVATVSVLVCIKLYLQRAKKITSKFMYSSYALRIRIFILGDSQKFLGIELSYFSITAMLFFSHIPSLFPKEMVMAWE